MLICDRRQTSTMESWWQCWALAVLVLWVFRCTVVSENRRNKYLSTGELRGGNWCGPGFPTVKLPGLFTDIPKQVKTSLYYTILSIKYHVTYFMHWSNQTIKYRATYFMHWSNQTIKYRATYYMHSSNQTIKYHATYCMHSSNQIIKYHATYYESWTGQNMPMISSVSMLCVRPDSVSPFSLTSEGWNAWRKCWLLRVIVCVWISVLQSVANRHGPLPRNTGCIPGPLGIGGPSIANLPQTASGLWCVCCT